MTYYYAETDGKVYLIDKDGRLSFPSSRSELPFQIKERQMMNFEGNQIMYCTPLLEQHPRHWVNKDRIPFLDEADPMVRKAINCTFPRLVVEAVIMNKGEVLLVMPKRGFSKGGWTLPGGFMIYGESPEEGVKREAREEIGADVQPERFLNLHSHMGQGNDYQWIIFYYLTRLSTGKQDIKPNHEIKKLDWFDASQVPQLLVSPLMAHGFQEILDEDMLELP